MKAREAAWGWGRCMRYQLAADSPWGPFLEETDLDTKGFPLPVLTHLSHFHKNGRDFFIGRQKTRLQTPLDMLTPAHAFPTIPEPGQPWVGLCRKQQDPRGSQGLEVNLAYYFKLWILFLVLSLAGSQCSALDWERGLDLPLANAEWPRMRGTGSSTQKEIHFTFPRLKGKLL